MSALYKIRFLLACGTIFDCETQIGSENHSTVTAWFIRNNKLGIFNHILRLKFYSADTQIMNHFDFTVFSHVKLIEIFNPFSASQLST